MHETRVGSYHGQFPVTIVDESRSTIPDYLPLNLAYSSLGGNSALFNLADGFATAPLSSISNTAAGNTEPVVNGGTLNLLSPSSSNVVSLIAANLKRNWADRRTHKTQSHLTSPYALHGALALERQLGKDFLATGAYVGTLGRHLLRVTTPNGGSGRTGLGNFHLTYGRDCFPFFSGNCCVNTT